jgi:cell division protein FtsZ
MLVEEPKEELPPVAVQEEELVLTGELEENTPTGSIDFVLEDEKVTHGFEPINISLTEIEPTNDWSDEDALKMEMMIKSFRDGLVKYADLEGPAFRRSRVELWKRPAIPAHEMEQHWLK